MSKSASIFFLCTSGCKLWSLAVRVGVNTRQDQFVFKLGKQAHTRFKRCFSKGRSAEANYPLYFLFSNNKQQHRLVSALQ